jgi:hypothetical protein
MFANRFTTALLLALAFASQVPAATPATTTAELEVKLQALATQVQSLQAELAALKAQNAVSPDGNAGSPLVAASPVPAATATRPAPADPRGDGALDWFGYGEISYSRPDASTDTTADVGRFVLGTSFQFDDRTRLVSELEIEHAIASSDDAGEVEVEQAYIERKLGDSTFAKFGLFLIPSGMLNESHEPTSYYGVFRNLVDTAIIPSTWRELGVSVQGRLANGVGWDVGVTTGPNISGWDPASPEGMESPLGSIHQEGQLAAAHDLSGFVALNYTGLPGLRVGASLFTGDVGQGQQGFDNRLSLWETHARWTPGAWDLSAEYAQGRISGTAATNQAFIGNPVLVPEEFYGWYAQAAYVATLPNNWTLAPFARFERVNTASSYTFIGAGVTPDALRAEEVGTFGLNLNISTGVVFKVDYQSFDRDSANDRFDLGLGYAF